MYIARVVESLHARRWVLAGEQATLQTISLKAGSIHELGSWDKAKILKERRLVFFEGINFVRDNPPIFF